MAANFLGLIIFILGTTVDDRLCDSTVQPMPKIKECNPEVCPPANWVTYNWSPCSASCGGGKQSRQVYCAEIGTDGLERPLPQEHCLKPKPSAERPCNLVPCLRWVPGPWSRCSVMCGKGYKTRSVTCRDAKDEHSEDCAIEEIPQTKQPCDSGFICDDLKPNYVVGEWGPCNSSCGQGSRQRTVSCKIYLQFSQTIAKLPDIHCPGPRPPNIESCYMKPCAFDMNRQDQKSLVSSSVMDIFYDESYWKDSSAKTILERQKYLCHVKHVPLACRLIGLKAPSFETESSTSSSNDKLSSLDSTQLTTNQNWSDKEDFETLSQNPLSVVKEETTYSDETIGVHSTNTRYSKILPDEKIFREKSSVFQDSSLITDNLSLNSNSSFTDTIEVTSRQDKDPKLISTVSQISFVSTSNEENSLEIKSSTSEESSSRNPEIFKTESTTQISSILANDDTALHSKLSSSIGITSSSAETSEIESTAGNSISSSKVTSIAFTDEFLTDNNEKVSSIESITFKTHFTSDSIPQDHIIEISSIRTARIVITTLFLAIALTALTVLAVYIFRLRRRGVEYDQLMLIS